MRSPSREPRVSDPTFIRDLRSGHDDPCLREIRDPARRCLHVTVAMRAHECGNEVRPWSFVGVLGLGADGRSGTVDVGLAERERARPVVVPLDADDLPRTRRDLGAHFQADGLAHADPRPLPPVGAHRDAWWVWWTHNSLPGNSAEYDTPMSGDISGTLCCVYTGRPSTLSDSNCGSSMTWWRA